MIVGALGVIVVAMVITLFRAFRGPRLYNRILAINMFGTKTVLFIALVGFLTGRPDYLDIAMLYALVNFVALIAVLRLTHSHDLIERASGGSQ